MTKKWLYSAAMGALLIASEAFGVTVHDVLSNGFWSAEHRGTEAYLQEVAPHDSKIKKNTAKENADGTITYSVVYVLSGPIMNQTFWKSRRKFKGTESDSHRQGTAKTKLIDRRDGVKEKTVTVEQDDINLMPTKTATSIVYDIQETYMAKPKSKTALPMGPMVPDVIDSVYQTIIANPYWSAEFYGTEHTATTNIVSDSEAFITGVIRETGYIHTVDDYVVEQPYALLRSYTRHITTDANHVYEDQDISEVSTNDPDYNTQKHLITQYTATFKKGRWKGSTETRTERVESHISGWAEEHYGGTGTTSVHNELAPTYGVRPGVAVDEHTQRMLDELNRSAGVRVVVSGQEKRPISKVKRSAHEQE